MCATPPSEPDVRISRIRLSSRQFLFRDWHFTPGSGFENHPGLEFRHRVFTPAVLDTVTGAANMRSDHADRFTQFSQGWASSTFLGLFANIVDFFRSPCSSRICLPTRLGSTPVTALHRYYAGSDSPPPLTTTAGYPSFTQTYFRTFCRQPLDAALPQFSSTFPPPGNLSMCFST